VKKVDSAQSLSAMSYAMMAVVGLLVAGSFTLFYIYRVPKLVESGTQGQVFYVLLIPWALASAAFLFGAMKSYARLTYKSLGSVLELGGPVVLFALVIIGGFKLVPPAPQTFDLVVRVSSDDNPLFTSGQITVDVGGILHHANIGPDGEANFKGISATFKGIPIRVLAKVEGYEEGWLTPTLESNVLNLKLKKEIPVTVQTITLKPAPKERDVKIRVDGQKFETSSDGLGGYTFSLNRKSGDRALFEVFVDGTQVHHEYHTVGSQIEVEWVAPGSLE